MLTSLTILLLLLLSSASAAEVSFNSHIRPILSDRCLSCHGPDEKNRKAKLRLDVEDGLFNERDGKFIIKPGAPRESELYARITSTDPDEKMPPAESHLTLSEAEIDLLRAWIQQGAKWERHWAFIPVREVTPPAVNSDSSATK